MTLPEIVIEATLDCDCRWKCRVQVDETAIGTYLATKPVYNSDGDAFGPHDPSWYPGRLTCLYCGRRWRFDVSEHVLSFKPISQRRDESA